MRTTAGSTESPARGGGAEERAPRNQLLAERLQPTLTGGVLLEDPPGLHYYCWRVAALMRATAGDLQR